MDAGCYWQRLAIDYLAAVEQQSAGAAVTHPLAYVQYLKTAVHWVQGAELMTCGVDWQMQPKATNQAAADGDSGASFEKAHAHMLRQCFLGCDLRYAPPPSIVGPSL